MSTVISGKCFQRFCQVNMQDKMPFYPQAHVKPNASCTPFLWSAKTRQNAKQKTRSQKNEKNYG